MSGALTFEEALSLTSEPLAVFDAEANLRIVNPAFREALRQLEGFLSPGTPWPVVLSEAIRRDHLTETDASNLRMIEERLLDRPKNQPEVLVQLADGRSALASLSRTSDDGFSLALCPQNSGDVSDEPNLEEIMSKVLQACPTCLTMSRIGDGQILYRSPAARELLGKGFNSLAHFANRNERADFLANLLPTTRVDDMRITASGRHGRNFPAAISARLIEYRGEDVIVASIDDLTERLAAEAEIERQGKQLFQLEKMSALGEVLSGIAHELNNPLSVVVGNAHLLLEEEVSDNLRPRIEKMTSAAERCVRIVRTFLSMARDRPLDLEVCSVPEIIQSAIDAFSANTNLSEDVAILADVPSDLHDVSIDEVQIVQVLVNILTNAAQAMAAANTNGQIQIKAYPNNTNLRIEISDNGPGVPADIADHIFDPLFTTKDVGDGTGLGLALCHRIVVAHGGSLELANQPNSGATFVIELPSGYPTANS